MAGAPISVMASQLSGVVRGVHGRPCHLVGGQAHSTEVGVAYLVFFDRTTANVTLGTTVPTWFLSVSPGDNDPVRGGPVAFSTALSIAAVTAPTGATGANIHLNITIE